MNTLAPIHNSSQAKRIHSWFMNVQDTWFLELRYKLHLNAKFNRLSWCYSIWWWRLYLYIAIFGHTSICWQQDNLKHLLRHIPFVTHAGVAQIIFALLPMADMADYNYTSIQFPILLNRSIFNQSSNHDT